MPNFPPGYAEQEKYYASEEYQTGAKNAIANNQPLPTYDNPNPVSNSEVTSQPPRSSKKRGGILRYPLEALTGTTDYLQIDIKEYIRNADNAKLIGAKGFGRNTLNNRVGQTRSGSLATKSVMNTGTIILQIPSDIKDGNTANYGESKMNTLTGAAAGAMMGVMKSGATSVSMALGNMSTEEGLKKIRSDIGGNLTAGDTDALIDAASMGLTVKATSSAMGIFGANVSPEQLLARSSGQIFNPNLELLFNGPSLRSFSFSFKMTPRSAQEARQCKLIIRSFKQNMAPKTGGDTIGGSAIFMKTPNLFELRYRKGNSDHPFLNNSNSVFLLMLLLTTPVRVCTQLMMMLHQSQCNLIFNLRRLNLFTLMIMTSHHKELDSNVF